MPCRESLTVQVIVLLLLCSFSLGCGITSKRTSLEDAVDELDVAQAQRSNAEDTPAPIRELGQHPDAAGDADGAPGEIALVNAEQPIAEREDAWAEEDPAPVGKAAVARAKGPVAHPIETITADRFQTEVLAADTPVLVDFYAQQCGPCKKLAPILEELAADTPDVKIVKVDIEESAKLAKVYRVRSVPTLILFKQGSPVSHHLGFADRRTLDGLLSR